MDVSFQQSKLHPNLYNVSTTDFFYPLIQDPYLQGRIACCNVLSDMYASGIYCIDNMLMILGVSSDMNIQEQTVTTKLMIKGFNDTAEEAGTCVSGGQTVYNPWPIIGGVAMTVASDTEFIRPEYAMIDDVIILTKPIGTQVAVNVMQWYSSKPELADMIKDVITQEEGVIAYNKAVASMCRLNKNAAQLAMKYKAHAMTDITGFGLLGHANNLAKALTKSKTSLTLKLNQIPVIKDMLKVEDAFPFNLRKGYSAETSGGLLILLKPEYVESFIKELKEVDKADCHIVGEVVEGDRMSYISDDACYIEV